MTLYRHTTAISPSKTAGQIVDLLGKAGANQILTDHKDGKIVGIAFSVDLQLAPNDPAKTMRFRLPIYPDRVLKAFVHGGRRPTDATREQADRTAWRVALEWLRAQVAYMETGQVTAAEVFLPYLVVPGGETLYRSLETKRFAGLLPAPKREASEA